VVATGARLSPSMQVELIPGDQSGSFRDRFAPPEKVVLDPALSIGEQERPGGLAFAEFPLSVGFGPTHSLARGAHLGPERV
jgi:hypothetical protein